MVRQGETSLTRVLDRPILGDRDGVAEGMKVKNG